MCMTCFHYAACLNVTLQMRVIALHILHTRTSIVACERASTTGSLKSGSLPLGLVYTLQ